MLGPVGCPLRSDPAARDAFGGLDRPCARRVPQPAATATKDRELWLEGVLLKNPKGTFLKSVDTEETLLQLAKKRGKQVSVHLFGQAINAETYALCKADVLLKGEGEAADNIVGGPEHSTLSSNAFPGRTFDFMLSNPPYGKSWKSDLERMGGKAGIKDPRFVVQHRPACSAGHGAGRGEELSLITRSSDGQMLFLVNMLSKMKHNTPLGSRIAEVHNGSSLFTGDAGQGEIPYIRQASREVSIYAEQTNQRRRS